VQNGRDATTNIALRPSVRADGTMISSFDPSVPQGAGGRSKFALIYTFDLTSITGQAQVKL
jgi:hypothetical protein